MRHSMRAAASLLQTDAAELEQLLERARVVGVLDAWAVDPYAYLCGSYESAEDHNPCCFVDLVKDGVIAKRVIGLSPDAARAAAAKAIESGEVR